MGVNPVPSSSPQEMMDFGRQWIACYGWSSKQTASAACPHRSGGLARADRSGVPCEAIPSRPLLQRPEGRGRVCLVLFWCHGSVRVAAQSGIKQCLCALRGLLLLPRPSVPLVLMGRTPRPSEAHVRRTPMHGHLIYAEPRKAPRNHDQTIPRSNRTTARKLNGLLYFSK